MRFSLPLLLLFPASIPSGAGRLEREPRLCLERFVDVLDARAALSGQSGIFRIAAPCGPRRIQGLDSQKGSDGDDHSPWDRSMSLLILSSLDSDPFIRTEPSPPGRRQGDAPHPPETLGSGSNGGRASSDRCPLHYDRARTLQEPHKALGDDA